MSDSTSEQVVFVVGAAGGIGKAIAQDLGGDVAPLDARGDCRPSRDLAQRT